MSDLLPRHELRLLIAVLALAALAWGVTALQSQGAGVSQHRLQLGQIPVTVFSPAAVDGPGAAGTAGQAGAASASAPTAPVVVLAHGFAGSQQLMQPLALSLARHGFTAVTFDFPGHGRHPGPMHGGLADQQQSLRTLLGALDQVVGWAQGRAAPGDGVALLGHSMASDIVVRQAQALTQSPAAAWATVTLSLFAPSITASSPAASPRNLLVLVGAWEPGMLHQEALRVVGLAAAPQAAQFGQTYGNWTQGTARRAVLAPGVEHIAVLYSATSAAEAVNWLRQARGLPAVNAPFTAAYGLPLLALLTGVLALAWAAAGWLPRATVGSRTTAAPWPWRRFWALLLGPAVATPLLLWKLPTEVLPILLGDYLLLHFGLYGVLTALGLWRLGGPALAPLRTGPMVLATALVAGFGLLLVGGLVNAYLFNLSPVPARWPVIGALLVGMLPWFMADEALTRSPHAPRAAYLASKAALLCSLVLAIALNPGRLFFLALIVPAILLLFIVFGLLSRWVHARTGHPAVAALAHALVFAWFMALTFPLVA